MQINFAHKLYAILGTVTTITLLVTIIAGSFMMMTPNKPPESVPPVSPFDSDSAENDLQKSYSWNLNITATMFWVGEGADLSNDFIHNRSSAWVEDWVESFGGVDDPENRCGNNPCGFTPKENVFYFALPYNDLDHEGNRKTNATLIPWYQTPFPEYESQVKNRWIEVRKNKISAYAQWEDVGPFNENDVDYVFGDKPPQDKRAGLDLSPATSKYIDLGGRAQVKWRFVDAEKVPIGPWKQKITE